MFVLYCSRRNQPGPGLDKKQCLYKTTPCSKKSLKTFHCLKPVLTRIIPRKTAPSIGTCLSKKMNNNVINDCTLGLLSCINYLAKSDNIHKYWLSSMNLFGGGKIYCYANFLLFSDQILEGQKSPMGENCLRRSPPCPPPPPRGRKPE